MEWRSSRVGSPAEHKGRRGCGRVIKTDKNDPCSFDADESRFLFTYPMMQVKHLRQHGLVRCSTITAIGACRQQRGGRVAGRPRARG